MRFEYMIFSYNLKNLCSGKIIIIITVVFAPIAKYLVGPLRYAH